MVGVYREVSAYLREIVGFGRYRATVEVWIHGHYSACEVQQRVGLQLIVGQMPSGCHRGCLHLVHHPVHAHHYIVQFLLGALYSLFPNQLARTHKQYAQRHYEYRYQKEHDAKGKFQRQLSSYSVDDVYHTLLSFSSPLNATSSIRDSSDVTVSV